MGNENDELREGGVLEYLAFLSSSASGLFIEPKEYDLVRAISLFSKKNDGKMNNHV